MRGGVVQRARARQSGGVAHAFVGDEWTRGLSGGEKRRVSIATELLTSPAIMFLDEPTTGLDSTNAAKVVDILAALGDGGVTVVLSIHQPRPDVFRLLDRILVMSGTGRAVYSGASNSAEAHFESLGYAPPRPEGVNVADYVLDVVLRASDDEAKRMVLDFDASAAAARDATARARIAAVHAESGTTLPRTRKFRASFATQTKALTCVYRAPRATVPPTPRSRASPRTAAASSCSRTTRKTPSATPRRFRASRRLRRRRSSSGHKPPRFRRRS